jgi:hypothetical protein
MARLSDFQKPATPVSFVVDANVMNRNAKAAASRVNWRNTKITEQGGAIESDPFRNIPLFASLHDRRTRMHHALDRALDDDPTAFTESNGEVGEAAGAAEGFANIAKQVVGGAAQNLASAALMEGADAKRKDRRARMHAALDKLLDSMEPETQNKILAEPNTWGEDDDEPEEESEDDESPESLDSAMDALHKRLRALLHGADGHDARRQRYATRDSGAAKVISPRKARAGHTSGYVNDAAFIAEHLDPSMLCSDAEAQLHDISYERQADDANRGYWSGLFYFLKSQPAGSRIRDVENKACLSSLLMRTVGGMHGAFGV